MEDGSKKDFSNSKSVDLANDGMMLDAI